MRKFVLASLTCVALTVIMGAQQNIAGKHRKIFAAGGCPFTDSFSGTGALGSSWVFAASSQFSPNYPAGNLLQSSGTLVQSSTFDAGVEILSNSTCTFSEDQYIYSTVESYTNGGLSLYVLAATGGGGSVGYGVTWTYNSAGVLTLYNGTTTVLSSSCGSIVDTDVVGIAVTGTGGSQAINVYINTGSGFASPVCTVSDHTITSGYPGIGINSTFSSFGPITAGNGTI